LAFVAGQHDIGGFVQEGPHPPVPAFRDAAGVVDLARLMPSGTRPRRAPTSRYRQMRGDYRSRPQTRARSAGRRLGWSRAGGRPPAHLRPAALGHERTEVGLPVVTQQDRLAVDERFVHRHEPAGPVLARPRARASLTAEQPYSSVRQCAGSPAKNSSASAGRRLKLTTWRGIAAGSRCVLAAKCLENQANS
jgi:hypothetical protein